jgi:hypothetical protein
MRLINFIHVEEFNLKSIKNSAVRWTIEWQSIVVGCRLDTVIDEHYGWHLETVLYLHYFLHKIYK